MAQMSPYSYPNFIFIRETFPELLVKIGHDDVILRQITSFSYVFPYYDVIGKNADFGENNEVMPKLAGETEFPYATLPSR